MEADRDQTEMNGEYAPHRLFNDDVLVLPSGRSLIAQLLIMANQLVIEDADLLPYHLERHFKQFALGDLSVTDLTDRAKRRGAAVYLVEKKPARRQSEAALPRRR